jgi:hypothetical protein
MTPVCSAKDCTRPAAWALLWNNPKLHTPDRRKSWLACDQHRDSLADFLRARRFLRDVERLEATVTAQPTGPQAQAQGQAQEPPPDHEA